MDAREQLIEYMAKRIRWAQHVDRPWAADLVAREFLDGFEEANRRVAEENEMVCPTV